MMMRSFSSVFSSASLPRATSASRLSCSVSRLPRRHFAIATLPASHPQTNADPAELRRRVNEWRRPHTPGLLTPAELEQFYEEGFVIKHGVFKRDERLIQEVMNGINDLVDHIARLLHKAGKIKDPAEKAGFYERLTLIDQQFPNASVLLHKHGALPKSFTDLWSDPRLLSAAVQIIGPDVAGHPVWNLRTKVPYQEQSTVPWHQDSGYLHHECWSVLQATAWVPLIDANLVNGCLQVARGGHRPGITATHTCCAGGTWYTELSEEEMKKTLGVKPEHVVTCEMPLGSVLFLNNLIPHRSLENFSKNIRWSLDLRWQRPDLPNGFYGLKDSILMRNSKNPNHVIDWQSWGQINRAKLQDQFVKSDAAIQSNLEYQKAVSEVPADGEFNTVISGPWMKNWEIVHHNRHTRFYDPARPIDKA